MILTHATADLVRSEGLQVTSESRFWSLENKYIEGDVVIEPFCSNYTLRNLYIRGRLVVKGGNFLGQFENVFIDGAQGHAFNIGDGAGVVCCALSFRGCFSRHASSWGWFVTNQQALSMVSCAADANKDGGFLLVSTNGTIMSPSAESNPIGMRLFDCSGKLMGENLSDNQVPLVINGGSIGR